MPVLQAFWKGQFQLSLVSFPVSLYAAASDTGRVTLHQLHGVKNCYRRIKQQKTCPVHGPVNPEEIVRGYEYERDRYVVVDDADLQRIKLPTERILEIVQFVKADELDPIYFYRPYYMAPEGRIAEKGFRVIREAMRQTRKVGIGRVVMLGHERAVAVAVEDNGFRVTTLRYADQVRPASDAFESIKEGEVDKNQLSLAKQLVEQFTEPLDPSRFRDRYQESLKAIVEAKAAGVEPTIEAEPTKAPVINLIKALEKSLAEIKTPKKPPAGSIKGPAAKRKRGRGA